ncbi:lipoprotein-releasing ABC transporter permease subunit [Oceanibacterium hippocampi]|uniref:Lipoprotein-releasing system transmembrane protein LolC n=1 Tax=Oceanibacterium hippocampi TaxID=745714 RepID=A0A1Y5T6T2_9PROT|nr:lipoprotein-releasing ABC transporter permease subunit [Oceanibacterium hippocampi]SLN53838.1 Lipoprotein-releasing system transmembrane protein LolC [Oceanibacterium hippocampi]
MFSALEWTIAARYLRARREEGFISVIAGFSFLGIMLGVATLIIVMSVMNGFRAELLDRILGLNGHLTVQAGDRPLDDYEALSARILAIDGIRRVTPILEGQVLVTHAGRSSGALLRGIRADDLAALDIRFSGLRDGLEDFQGNDAVILGYRLARQLGLRVGERVNLVSPQGSATAFGVVPRARAYTIVGTFNAEMYEYDSGYLFMPLDAAQAYLKSPGAVGALEIMADDGDRALSLKLPVLELIGGGRYLYDWMQSRAALFNALAVERNVMFLILTLIIVVAAFNMISSLIMLVKDKGRGIAILRTMGATRGMVLRVFLIAGSSVGAVGTLAGFLLGLGFCDNIDTIKGWIEQLTGANLFAAELYFLSHLPAKIDPLEVALVVAMALSLSFLATLYPAWRAARLNPVEALRYE